MQVIINGSPVYLDPKDQLGAGGEGVVYKKLLPITGKEMAIKIFHPIDPSLPPPERRACELLLQKKFDKAKAFPPNLPPQVLYPRGEVLNTRSEKIGLYMDLSMGEDISNLGRVGWKEKNNYNLLTVIILFRLINQILRGIHGCKVVVGDLNDGNIQVNNQGSVWFIDTDSMQVNGYPCIVAHEKYLDPLLYGIDLSKVSALTEQTDIYALAVMLFTSLLTVHPYGGNHVKYPTMLRRAEAGYSILNKDVPWPKKALHFSVLSDDLLQYFSDVFDKKMRNRLDNSLLLDPQRCPSCNKEHFRRYCPTCQSGIPNTTPVIVTITSNGKCHIKTVVSGVKIHHATSQKGVLRILWEKNGDLYREDHTTHRGRVLIEKAGVNSSMKFGVSGEDTHVAQGSLVVSFVGKTIKKSTTGQKGNRPVFASNSIGLYTVPGGELHFDGKKVGKILEGQTWLWAEDKGAFGFYQVGKIPFFFLHRPGDMAEKNVGLPIKKIDGKLKGAECYFDQLSNNILLMLSIERLGLKGVMKTWNTMTVLRMDGTVKSHMECWSDDYPFMAEIRGKLIHRGVVYSTTDQGIMAIIPQPLGGFAKGNLFTDTAGFVSLNDDLLPAPDLNESTLSLFVVGNDEIKHITTK